MVARRVGRKGGSKEGGEGCGSKEDGEEGW